VIRTLLMLGFWALALPAAALIGFPWTLLTGDVRLLYWLGTRGAWMGVRLAGVRVEINGLERLDPAKTYIFLSNHSSNLDPPILMPLLPRRTSVLVKKELFRIPILGRAMRMGSLVPVDRSRRDAAVHSLRAAADVLRSGISMTIFVEGTRSFDGRLLRFKKGPFYLAMDSGVEVVPVTIAGTHELMPKGRFSIRSGTVRVTFHPPIDPRTCPDRQSLMETVRAQIASALPGQCGPDQLSRLG
jgi:1-acyl-sn-glycerol-3-phosphate acyltransferase